MHLYVLSKLAGLMSFNHKKLYPWDLKIGLNIKGNLNAFRYVLLKDRSLQ